MKLSISKKGVIVGGSNGIGLSISLRLINMGYHVIILDKEKPSFSDSVENYTYYKCDLLDFDTDLFEKLSQDDSIEILFITAGFGRVAEFEYLHVAEIEKMIKVNTISNIKIIRIFYNRIKSNKKFYCGVMGSIAGLISSPMFSVYAASKAAIFRFVESVNIEIEEIGSTNRILNVSPGSIKGTKFNGGDNDLEMTKNLAEQIIKHLISSEELFIPEYNEIYKSVITDYNEDAHKFGLRSYQYKKNSGRVINKNNLRIGYLSGTFDLFHVGHLNLLRHAKEYCDYLIVGVHLDASHKDKKTFISFEERMDIVGSIKYVDKVVQSCSEDNEAWELWHYNILFVGSDYKGSERFQRYEKYFENKDVEIVYFPYTKSTSSTQIRNIIMSKTKKD